MTQDQSALLAQLDALKSADAGAVFAELIRVGLQALIEAEATEAIGAGRYERTGGRGTHRNGHRPKTVSTTAGDVEVQIRIVEGAGTDATVSVPGGGAVAVPIARDTVWEIDPGGASGIHGQVTMSGSEALAGYAVWPSDAAADPVTVYP